MKNTTNQDARIILPLILIFWIPCTIAVFLSIYQEIAWQVFDCTKGITPNGLMYGSLFNAYLSVLKEIGLIGSMFIFFLFLGYLWMTVMVIKAIKAK